MAKTKHIQQRMNQRSIRHEWLNIVKSFGSDNGDKTILSAKGIDQAIQELKKISSHMQKMRSRGGIVLVEEGGDEITTYALDSYKPQLRHQWN